MRTGLLKDYGFTKFQLAKWRKRDSEAYIKQAEEKVTDPSPFFHQEG